MRLRSGFLAVICILFSSTVLLAQAPDALAPDAIYYNGKIVTVDKPFSIDEAFAIKNERFVAVGANTQVRALAGRNTQLVDLKGRTVIPGLMDNHNHQIWHARFMHRGIDMINVPSLAEMLSRIRQGAAKAKPGEVVVGSGGWNPRNFPEKRNPTRQELDDAAPNNPVFIFTGNRNNAWLNSLALKALGIDRNTKDWGSFPILKDENTGEPTGELSGGEQVLAADWKLLPQPTVEQQIEWLEQDQLYQHSLGLTGIRELSLPVEHMRVYMEMEKEHRLTMRVSMGLMFGVQYVDGWNPVQMDELLARCACEHAGFGSDMLQFDGTLAEFEVTTQRVGTLNRKPYPPNSHNVGLTIFKWPHADWFQPIFDQQGNYYGVQRMPTDKFIATVVKMNRMGWRPGFHISGDRALELHLAAYEAADRDQSIRDKRWVAEHNGGTDAEQTARLVKLNMLVSIQYQAGRFRDWIKEGLTVSSGSDWPAFDSNPFKEIAFYVTGKNSAFGAGPAQSVPPDETISREQALRWATNNNAYMVWRENSRGSIEAGKLADFLVLNADILTVPDDQLKDLHPLATYVGGKKVFAVSGSGF